MQINILGGGPSGLYFAILMKKLDPAHKITILERDGPDDTFGWGIVFSGRIMSILGERDPESHADIMRASQVWDSADTVHRGMRVSMRGNTFSGIARIKFLNILQQRCRDLGVQLKHHTNIIDIVSIRDCELLVGADGANSLVRQTYDMFFQPLIDLRQNRFTWLGTHQPFSGLTMIFRTVRLPNGEEGLFIAHAYRFSPTTSTFIVECPPQTWLHAGLDRMTEAVTLSYLAEVFRDDLEGHDLVSNNFLRWRNFPLIKNKHWHHENVVLLGDALHTAHFSIGSGTRLALEDSMALADAFARYQPTGSSVPAPGHGVTAALVDYEHTRKPRVDEFQEAATTSLSWLENVQEHLHFDPVPFAYGLMTRSGRQGYHRIKHKDPEFIAQYDAWKRSQPREGPIPDQFLELFNKRSLGHLAMLMVDGTPHVTPVWVDYDGQHVIVNSAKGRLKDIAMSKRPQVAIEIGDPDNPNRYVLVRGVVVEISEEGADAHLDKLAQRYLSREVYPVSWRFPGEVRRIYKVLPTHVTAWEPFG
jgi:anthraniloyl-CoA monooxygenase